MIRETWTDSSKRWNGEDGMVRRWFGPTLAASMSVVWEEMRCGGMVWLPRDSAIALLLKNKTEFVVRDRGSEVDLPKTENFGMKRDESDSMIGWKTDLRRARSAENISEFKQCRKVMCS
jgi:hypothetical protein